MNSSWRNYSYYTHIYIYTETSNRLVFANNRRDRELRKRQQVHVGAYVKRRNVLERFVARFDGACRGVAERARVDQFQSKAGCHSSRLDYSARISPLSHSLSLVSRLVSSLNLCARRSLLRAYSRCSFYRLIRPPLAFYTWIRRVYRYPPRDRRRRPAAANVPRSIKLPGSRNYVKPGLKRASLAGSLNNSADYARHPITIRDFVIYISEKLLNEYTIKN